jgi:hypothetical protein
MSLDKMSLDKMSVDKMSVDMMSVDMMSVDMMSVDIMMSVDNMKGCQLFFWFVYKVQYYMHYCILTSLMRIKV